MKIIWNSKKEKVLALCFIVVAGLMVILTFAIPGKRTFLGTDSKTGEFEQDVEIGRSAPVIISRQYTEKEFKMAATEKELFPMQGKSQVLAAKDKAPQAPVQKSPFSGKSDIEKMFAQQKSGQVSNETPAPDATIGTGEVTSADTEINREPRDFQEIPSDHIPRKWEYKMIGEPSERS